MKSFASLAVFVAAAAATTLSGPARVYMPDGARGACGTAIQENSTTVALQPSNFNLGLCGTEMTVSSANVTITVTIEDSCAACRDNGIELPSLTFSQLVPIQSEEVTVTYTF
ncbi:hypothetical protein C8R44DRAFT_735114 [Mycena epipterygia]|nr:hypothetical protein C8R44DRAFT_735114 [Mycena epipterygia]